MRDLEISLLGEFRLACGQSGEIPLNGTKPRLLLAMLALRPGRRMARAALRGWLWPEVGERSAQGHLRFLLHQTRRALPAGLRDIVCADRVSIWLLADRVRVDAEEFARLARDGSLSALEEAARLYRGHLLDDLTDLPTHLEEWLQPERERLREMARAALRQLFAMRVWRRELDRASELGTRCLAIDPYCEDMQAAMIRLHVSQGDRSGALAAERRFRQRLLQDLNAAPEIEFERMRTCLNGNWRRRSVFNPAWVLGREDEHSDGRPLVAVQIFQDISGSEGMAGLASALSEDVIVDLGRFRRLAVLARHTSYALATLDDPQERLHRLGVRYLVEGSVRRAGNAVRVNVSLAECSTSRQLWAWQFDGGLDELPHFQETVARSIVSAIPVEVEQAELDRIRHLEIADLNAYEHYLLARRHQSAADLDSHSRALRHFQRALDLDEGFAAAHAGLALSIFLGGTDPSSNLLDPRRPALRLEQALAHARRAIELDPVDPQGHWMSATLRQMTRDFSSAAYHIEHALELAPGDAETAAYVGLELAYGGAAGRAVDLTRRALKLNPYHPPDQTELLGKSCFVARDYDEALMWLKQSPDRVITNRAWLAASAAHAGLLDEARMHARSYLANLRKFVPSEVIEARGGTHGLLMGVARFRESADLEHYSEGLALAGIEP